MKHFRHVIGSLAIVAAVLAGCGKEHSLPTAENPPAASVRVITVESKPRIATEEVVGTVRAKLRAAVEAKVSGRIEVMNATPGRQFKAGETLAQLDAREIQARLEQALAVRDQAVRDAARFAKLIADKAVTPAEAEAVDSRLRVAKAAVTEAETMLGYTKVTASFNGVVTRKLADVGDLATPGRPIAEIEDPTALRLEADVPEALVAQLVLGAKLRVHLGAGELDGTVSEIAPAADPASRTFLVKFDLPATTSLRTGQFGHVLVPIGESRTVRVPASAVTLRGQMEFVYVVAAGKAQLRIVKTGKRIGDEVELISGVDAGEQVIVAVPASLHDGQTVQLQP